MKLKTRTKYLYWGLATLAVGMFLTEAVLRWKWGLGNPVLTQADAEMGYRFQPNQTTTRLGNQIHYNQYSQRSDPLLSQPQEQVFRVLMVGDSVLNGGSAIDQSETISEQLEQKILKNGQTVEVLNASAGSWGIGNQWGYLQKFGTFKSDLLILQIGTHDLTQPTSTSARVGHDPNYPTEKPLLAWQELLLRYLLPRFHLSQSQEIPPTLKPEQQFEQNLDYLEQILQGAKQENLPVVVLYTPNWVDVLPTPHTPTYKPQFQRFLEAQQVPLIDVHSAWSSLPPETVKGYFRDSVHLTPEGSEAVADLLYENLTLPDFLILGSPLIFK
ncbi:SGNH/GDSL hydrolase family protein [Spirulina sp. CS-785/01]|uniref:SGNH/GDSL hydrolase family protein n=1 Tax=Spirulina sp. CS-785/01 TaxID=3021716 RepID=UPI00233149E0|nr:SGNH/GDSL hydrolase family protein [Spirulina sp. CS-785/01]MDB9314782.1 SGNH/GDSL hydrolase family protein [Spirulina sp. CS-785/01]